MKHWRFWVIGILLILCVPVNWLMLHFWPDIYWFTNLGYEQVFFTRLLAQSGLWLGSFLFCFGFIFTNFYAAKVFLVKSTADWRGNLRNMLARFLGRNLPEQREITVNSFKLDWLAIVLAAIAVFFALSLASVISSHWLEILSCFKQTGFAVADPLFGRDVSFYVFVLPVLKLLSGAGASLLFISALGALFLYMLSGQLVALRWHIFSRISRPIRTHLLILGFCFALWLLLVLRIAAYELLFSPAGVVYGAGFTDVYAQLVAFRVLSVAVLVWAAVLLAGIFTGNLSLPVIVGGISTVLWFGLSVVYPAVLQTLIVNPNEITKEAPYIQHSIDYTQKAYGLTDVAQVDFNYKNSITAEELAENKDILENIRLWDNEPLLETYRQIQGIRLYYDFHDVDIDRYVFAGQPTQVMISVRELDAARLPERARTWVNEKLKYTHGYGVVVNKVTEISEDGLPRLVVRDIPPVSAMLKITRPEIYYGEKTADYVVVNTKTEEFDYPQGDENAYTAYQGRGDVPLDSFFRRSLYAAKFQDFRLLISSYITRQSKVLYVRNIKDRVRKIAPFLRYDSDPYIVCAPDGRLFWIIDAYTVSNKYPYAQPYSRNINYIRNSVKIVVDAYNGTPEFYSFADDPILKTYARIFPGLFKPQADFPPELLPHIRYPLDLFYLQAKIYRTFHMNDPQIFYNLEDLWESPKETYEAGVVEVEPYYIYGKIPGEQELSFLLAVPFTPVNKNNLVSLLVVKCDPDDYGRFYLYKMPKNELVYGPMQIESRIDQDTEISKELSLWSQQGSRVIRGNMMLVPLANSFLYIEPIYLQATASKLPELKRIAVANGDALAMTPTLRDSLNVLTGLAPRPVSGAVPAAPTDNAELSRVREALRKAESALEELKETMQKL
ncbi:MAG: UPF0182 family protein [Candidatus Margulisbacteria bacterium]|jgi:uncharacterized membrane protein (UPF0182 family)|nr:UPF0182 family protein [Candidatus Margulisiibacteriota bacterium]